MLRAAQADACGTELAAELRVLGRVGVGAHTHRPELVGPGQDRVEVARDLGLYQRDRAEHDDAGRAVDRDDVAVVQLHIAVGDGRDAGGGVDLELVGTADAGLAHAAGDDSRVAGLATVRGQDALGRDHAVQVVGRGLPANQDDRAARVGSGDSVVSREDDLAHRSTR